MRILAQWWAPVFGLVCTSAACENDATVLLPNITSATLFASNIYSPPRSNLQSLCFVSATLPFSHWPPRTETLSIPVGVGREFRPVTAAGFTRDSLLPEVTVRFARLDPQHYSLIFGPPLSDTVRGDLDPEGAPLRILGWECPPGLPFRTDTALLRSGYVPDSAGPGYLSIHRAVTP
jgi:hypothetical protein